jgi:nucleotide-binding universal stress UspA family protein
MLDRILLPVDGSEIFSETLSYLRELNLDSATEVFLLHVLPPGSEKYTAGGAADHPLLKKYYDAMDSDGWKVSAELRSGEPTDEITQFAVQAQASLLVMSTHGRSGLEKIRAGSITEQVVRHSPCPTFIMHSTRDDTSDSRQGHLFHRMLVPLDGTEDSAAILPCVEKFAKRYHTEVVLFHDHPDCDESNEAKNRREFLGHHGVELANAGISVQLDCSTHRRPIHEILKRTDELDIDIVAMATHGNGGERRALEESVTANVMRHANRPLLVWSSDPQCPSVGQE